MVVDVMTVPRTGLARCAAVALGQFNYDSMDAVENALEGCLSQLESSPAQIQSLAGFDRIINVSVNVKLYLISDVRL